MSIASLNRSRIVAALLIVGTGCGREATGVPAVARFASQMLAGVAIDDRGVPLAGAPVRITGVVNGSTTSPSVTIAGCSGWRSFVDSLQTTSATGRFESRVGFGPATPPLCIAVEVLPPTGSPLRPGVTWIVMDGPTDRTDVPDTTHITVILPRN